jgi:hypothetical protein
MNPEEFAEARESVAIKFDGVHWSALPYVVAAAHVASLHVETDFEENETEREFRTINHTETRLLHSTRHQLAELRQALRSLADLPSDVDGPVESLVSLARKRLDRSGIPSEMWSSTLEAIEEWLRVFEAIRPNDLIYEVGDWRGTQMLLGPHIVAELQFSELRMMPFNGEWEYVGQQLLDRTRELMLDAAVLEQAVRLRRRRL